jgi:hypothetical protein
MLRSTLNKKSIQKSLQMDRKQSQLEKRKEVYRSMADQSGHFHQLLHIFCGVELKWSGIFPSSTMESDACMLFDWVSQWTVAERWEQRWQDQTIIKLNRSKNDFQAARLPLMDYGVPTSLLFFIIHRRKSNQFTVKLVLHHFFCSAILRRQWPHITHHGWLTTPSIAGELTEWAPKGRFWKCWLGMVISSILIVTHNNGKPATKHITHVRMYWPETSSETRWHGPICSRTSEPRRIETLMF